MRYFITVFFLFAINISYSQSVAINTSGSAANSKSILDIDVTTKGILIPRLTDAQRNAISSPATGLLFYNTTTDRFNYWNGSAWFSLAITSTVATNGAGTNAGSGVAINTSGDAAHHSAILDISGTTGGLLVPRMTTAQRNAITSPTTGLLLYNTSTNKINYRSSTAWVEPCSTSVVNTTGSTTSAGIAINTTGAVANTSALLDITSTTQGLLLPRLTSAQRNAITSPAEGLIIFNTTIDAINIYDGSGNWLNLVEPGLTTPVATAATLVDCDRFQANWNAVSGASSYEIDIATDASFFSIINTVNVGNTTSYTPLSLSEGTTYYYRIRAVNACNSETASSNTITVTTTAPVLAPTSVVISNITSTSFKVTWGVNTYYDIVRDTDINFGNPTGDWLRAGTSGGSNNYTFTGLTPGTTYYVEFIAVFCGLDRAPSGSLGSATTLP